MLSNDWMKSWILRSAWLTALLLVAFAITVEAQTVPSIVVSSTTTINSAGVSAAGKVVQDTCGNFYELENGGNLLEIPANGGAAIYLSSPGSHNSGDGMTGGLAIDGSNNLYVGNKWSADVFKIPSVNCVPNPSQSTFVLNANGGGALQGLGNYWYDPADITTDSAGDVFVNSRSGGSDSGGIYEQTPAGAVALVMGNDSGIGQITSLAVDSSGDVFFTVGNGNVYEVPVKSYGTSSPTAVITSGLTTAIGIAFDAVGNMYVGDSSNGNVYVVPFTTSGTSTTPALQFGSKFLFAQGLPLGGPLTMGSDRKSILFSNFGASIYQQIPGSANFGSIAVGSSGSATVNFQFNAATTVASISVASGGGFSNAGTGTCTAKAYAAGSSCTVNVSFAPGTPSAASGSVVLADASNNVLATAYLQGTGLGAGIAMDPGSVSSVGSGFGAPASIAVTSKGEYIADTNKNAVLFFATPSSAAVSYGSGLSKPAGVAVDGAGNLIIADTGNNRIVEVPVINGALSNAAQVVLVSATTSIAGSVLNAPAGVTVDGQGNLYIADTGNNRVVFVPYNGSWNLAAASVIGSGYTAPLATAVDSSGNVFVANSGSGQIYELQAPLSSGIQKLVAVGYSNPSALAIDASGSLFVVDQGAGIIFRLPNVGGTLEPNSAIDVGFGVAAPYGIALDSAGNLYATDMTNAAAYEVNRVSIATTPQAFGDWPVGTASGAWPIQVESEGNQSLVFASPFDTASGNTGDFSLATPSDACADGLTVAAGAGCELDATFTPTVAGARLETLVLNSNAVNATPAQVVLSGTGVAATATTTVLAITSPASGTPAFGQAITLTATVSATGATPTGNAMLLVDGNISAEATLGSSGVATFSLPTGLTGGSHTLQAVYQGTATFNGSTSLVKTITVGTAPTASAMAINSPYINPYSVASPQLVPVDLTKTPVTYTYVPQYVTFTVGIGFAGVGIPTGTVTYATGGTTLGTASVLPAAGGKFQASLTVQAFGPPCVVSTSVPTCPAANSSPMLPVGTDLVTATYSGDANYVGSATSGTIIVLSAPVAITTASGTSITVSSYSDTSVTFNSVSEGGWNGVVGFNCDPATLPANSRCVFSPGQATVLANTPTQSYPASPVTLTIAINQPPQTPTASKMIWWIAGPMGLLLLFARRRMKSVVLAGRWNILLLIAAVGVLSAGILASTGCNSISAPPFATPSGSKTVTVYASADPFKSGTGGDTVLCSTINTSPCSQKVFQVSVTVQ